MEKPSKYKSIPVTGVVNREFQELSSEDFDSAKTIVNNFILYFKDKHLH